MHQASQNTSGACVCALDLSRARDTHPCMQIQARMLVGGQAPTCHTISGWQPALALHQRVFLTKLAPFDTARLCDAIAHAGVSDRVDRELL
jgi:hypothetical protein